MISFDRAELVCREGCEAGFDRVGIAPAVPPPRLDYTGRWLAEGKAGEMDYLRKWHHLRADPRTLLEGARSIIVVADSYRQPEDSHPVPEGPPVPAKEPRASARAGATDATSDSARATVPASAPENTPPDSQVGQVIHRGRVARYAWGRDYHKVLRRKLQRFADRLHAIIDEPFSTRVCVDTAPLIEREFAAAAGIGWIGRNTLVLDAEIGSYFFLGAILTTLELGPSVPQADHCGTCTRCLDACPTDAFPAPYEMDATRCIAYLTIEHRSEIDPALAAKMGDWVFGCDVCQEVCPFNRKAPAGGEPAYRVDPAHPLLPAPPLAELEAIDDETCRQMFAGSAIRRATPEMLRRNARIAIAHARA